MFFKKIKKARPVKAVFWIAAFLLLFLFIIILPIYKNATMTPSQHFEEGMLALQNAEYGQARTHLLRAAQSKNAQAYYTLGKLEIEGHNEFNKPNALQGAIYFERAAELGHALSQYQIALMYDRGEGVAQNKEKALNYALLAAAQGHLDALYASAVWLERGYNGQARPFEALTFYEAAAQRGHQNAIISLISIYAGGSDVPANFERSQYWQGELSKIKKTSSVKMTTKPVQSKTDLNKKVKK